MAEGTAIIVGGGISAGTPFTERRYTLIVEDDPATIAAGRLRQLADATESILAPGPDGGVNTLVLGEGARDRGVARAVLIGDSVIATQNAGQGNDVVYIGRTIDRSGLNSQGSSVIIGGNFTGAFDFGSSVGVGYNITLSAAASNGVAIGRNVIVSGSGAVAVGQGSRAGGQSVAVGNAAQCTTNGVCIGDGSQANGQDAVGVGRAHRVNGARSVVIGSLSDSFSTVDAIVLGTGSSASHAGAIVIGHGQASLVANSVAFGGNTAATWVTAFRPGPNTATAYPGLTFFMPSAGAGTDVAAPHTTFRSGLSTGNAVGGELRFQSSVVVAGSSGTYQAAAERFAVIPSTGAADAPTLRLSNLTPTVVVGDDYIPITVAGNLRYLPAVVAAGQFGTIQIEEASDPTLRFVETGATPEWQVRATPADLVVEAVSADGTISLVPDDGGQVSARVDVDATADNVRLLLWDVSAAALVRVSRGAADSGGAGFRLLRVPN